MENKENLKFVGTMFGADLFINGNEKQAKLIIEYLMPRISYSAPETPLDDQLNQEIDEIIGEKNKQLKQ